MKYIILIGLLLFLGVKSSFPQSEVRYTEYSCGQIAFWVATEMPKLETAIDELEKFIIKNLTLLQEQPDLKGEIQIGFVVNCKGEAAD